MKLRFLVLLFSMFMFSSSLAKDDKFESIPFIISKPNPAYKDVIAGKSEFMASPFTMELSWIHSEEIIKFLKNAQKTFCFSVPDGNFKIWMKLDAEGKVLGVGASGESGVEVSFSCKR